MARFAILALLLLSGCAAPRVVERAAGPTPVPTVERPANAVLVGTTLSLSGRFSREGAILRDGYETWVRAANAGGGIDVGGSRRPAHLVVYDDESEPLTAASLVERLVEHDGVTLLLGPFSSQITTATATTAERLGALTVAPDGSAPALYARGLQMIVSILPTDDRYFHGLLDLAASVPPRRQALGFLIPEEAFFITAAEGARERARQLGLEPVVVERAPIDARDVVAPLDRIAQARPNGVVIGGTPDRLGRFLPQLRELRLAPPLRALLTGQTFADLPDRLGPDLDGVVTLDWWTPGLAASGPLLGSAADFAARFTQDHGYPPDARAAAAAAAGLALQLGIERAGRAEPGPVRAALAQLDATTFWGRLAWDPLGRNRAATVPVMQYQGGRLVVVHPAPFATARLRYPLGEWPGNLTP